MNTPSDPQVQDLASVFFKGISPVYSNAESHWSFTALAYILQFTVTKQTVNCKQTDDAPWCPTDTLWNVTSKQKKAEFPDKILFFLL